MKPVGAALKRDVGQDEQAAVSDQHDHVQAQRLADRPAVDGGHAVESAVEEPEAPAEYEVHRPDDEPTEQTAGQQPGRK